MLCCTYLQLAIEDALKNEPSIGKLISKARTIVKPLRTQTCCEKKNTKNVEERKIQKPIIDCSTRWGSTFDMLKRLLELKEFCTEMALKKFNNFVNF